MDEFSLDVSFSLDGIFLSDYTDVQLFPVNIYINNIEDNRVKILFVIHETLTLFKNNQKSDYELTLTPFIQEIIELTNPFKTYWSDKTVIDKKLLLLMLYAGTQF